MLCGIPKLKINVIIPGAPIILISPEVGFKHRLGSVSGAIIFSKELIGSLLVWAALSDFVMALFPTLLLWNLQMRRTLKFGLSGLMGLGVLAGIAAIVMTINLRTVLSEDVSSESNNSLGTFDALSSFALRRRQPAF